MNEKRPPNKGQKLPSLERLHVLFEYEPVSGTLFHKLSGEPAGTANSRGYLYVYIDGDMHPVHHIAWYMFHGKPCRRGCQIHHANRIPSDNSIRNLKRKRKLLSCIPRDTFRL